MTRRYAAAASAAFLVCLVLPAGAQSGKIYKTRLSPVPLDASMAATVSGLGSVTATLAANKLTITGTFDGLKSPATIAQIHKAQRGIRGPAVFDLKVTATGTSGTISGTMDMTPQQVADLDKGWFYVQLHSEKAPDGNLWGWLMPQENPTMKMNSHLLAMAAFAGAAVAMVAGQQPSTPVFTAAQASAGREFYASNCASCHTDDLGGRNEAPQLAGPNFMTQWRARSTRELYEYIAGAMPPGGSALTDDQYLTLAAFILQSNGAPAGANAFTATTAVPIGTIATGQRPAAPTPAATQTAAAGGRGGAGGQARPAAGGRAARRQGGAAQAGGACAGAGAAAGAPPRADSPSPVK